MILPPMRRPLMEQRRTDIQRVEAASAQYTQVYGRIRVTGIGETVAEIRFPVIYSERPFPLFGCETDVAAATRYEYFPTVNAIVSEWITTGTGVYQRFSGAKLSVRTTGAAAFHGSAEQRIYLSYAFAGVALTNMSGDA